MTSKDEDKQQSIRDAVKIVLTQIGEDPNREGLLATPDRVERMLQEICSGYQSDLRQIVNGAVFNEKTTGMVIIRDVEFYSLCEHHLLPFFGVVHFAYIPDGKIIGLSKIPRIIEMYARRLQVQERFTHQVLAAVEEVLQPKGCAIRVEASHLCAMMRGVKKDQTRLVTTDFSGVFLDDLSLRSEFLNQLFLDGEAS